MYLLCPSNHCKPEQGPFVGIVYTLHGFPVDTIPLMPRVELRSSIRVIYDPFRQATSFVWNDQQIKFELE